MIILSKTDLHNGSKKDKRKYGKIKNNKNIKNLVIYWNSLFETTKQYSAMVFSRLKFEKSLLLLLFRFIFHSKMIVHTAERAKQNILLKII